MNDIFFKTAEIIGILPKTSNTKSAIYHKIIPTVYILITTGNFASIMILSMQDLANFKSSGREFSFAVFGILIDTCSWLFYIIPLSFKNFIFIKHYRHMKIAFGEIDNILQLKKQKFSVQLLKFFIFHTFYLVFVTFRNAITSNNSYITINTIIFVLLDYTSDMEIIVVHRILNDLQMRMKIVNKLLLEIYQKAIVNEPNQSLNSRKWRLGDAQSVLDLIEVHTRIVRIIHIFNKLYGITILLSNLTFILEILELVLRLVTTGMESRSIYVTMVEVAADLVMWLVFIVNAQGVINEGKLLVTNCVEALTIAISLSDVIPDKISKYLEHFVQCASLNVPEFTAANLYSVNHATIFTMFNIIIGYIVVVLQSSNEQKKVN